MKILIADDDPDITAALSMLVSKMGHESLTAHDGEAALDVFREQNPDMAILDVMMPKMNGFDLCRAMRDESQAIPVMLLTARGDIVDKSVGFNAGADDYVVKPFDADELALRIQAHLRRVSLAPALQGPVEGVTYGDFSMDFRRRTVSVAGREVVLTPKEYHILKVLALNPGDVFTKERLVEEIWGAGYAGEINGVTVHIHHIREKVEPDPANPRYIKTVWRVGYKFGD